MRVLQPRTNIIWRRHLAAAGIGGARGSVAGAGGVSGGGGGGVSGGGGDGAATAPAAASPARDTDAGVGARYDEVFLVGQRCRLEAVSSLLVKVKERVSLAGGGGHHYRHLGEARF